MAGTTLREQGMSRILITGINGQLGFELRRSLAMLGECICLDRQQLDLSRPADIAAVLDQYQPDIIVNPAAYTAVDKAESDAELAHAVNAAAPAAMADWAAAKMPCCCTTPPTMCLMVTRPRLIGRRCHQPAVGIWLEQMPG
jgi:hypothetical protein